MTDDLKTLQSIHPERVNEIRLKKDQIAPLRLASSATWGLLDGASTGALVGANVFNSKLWVVGPVMQTIGGTVGMFCGAASGAILGAVVRDRKRLAKLISNYRQHYGIHKLKSI